MNCKCHFSDYTSLQKSSLCEGITPVFAPSLIEKLSIFALKINSPTCSKKEKGADNDPLGQLLIAMLTASELNNNTQPLYGAYVAGRNWFFLTLKDNTYCISNEYVATRDDIYDIFKIIKALKTIITAQTKATNTKKSNKSNL